MVIYKITNTLDGKCYIGQTKDFKRRIKEHLKCSGKIQHPLYNAINLYGKENFISEILYEFDYDDKLVNKQIANILEISFISNYNCKLPNGYNIHVGGNGISGINEPWNKGKKGVQVAWNKGKKGLYTQSDETRKKMSESAKGKKLTQEHKNKISKSKIGISTKPPTLETRQKMSNSAKGKTRKIESIEKMKQTRTKNETWKMTEETKKKLSMLLTGRKIPINVILKREETKKRNRELGITKTKPPSVETRKKMSESAKKRGSNNKGKPSKLKGIPKTEEHKNKISKSKKGHIVTEETRKKISETLKLKHD